MNCEPSGRPEATRQMTMIYRPQGTVSFPIGGHVNILSDYNETVPEFFSSTYSLQSCH